MSRVGHKWVRGVRSSWARPFSGESLCQPSYHASLVRFAVLAVPGRALCLQLCFSDGCQRDAETLKKCLRCTMNDVIYVTVHRNI